MTIGEAEYLEQRLENQIDWYERKSARSQSAYKLLRTVEIVAAASIPLLAGFGHESWRAGVAVGVLGLVVTVIAGLLGLYRFQENWSAYRATAESLEQEKFLYLTRAAPYHGQQPFELLVARVEGLIRSETTAWAEAVRATAEAEQAERERGSGA